jgi:hypothetical protein
MPYARTCTLVILGLIAIGCCAVAHAAEAGDKLRVGISPFAPFVMFTDKGPEGAAVVRYILPFSRKIAIAEVHV